MKYLFLVFSWFISLISSYSMEGFPKQGVEVFFGQEQNGANYCQLIEYSVAPVQKLGKVFYIQYGGEADLQEKLDSVVRDYFDQYGFHVESDGVHVDKYIYVQENGVRVIKRATPDLLEDAKHKDIECRFNPSQTVILSNRSIINPYQEYNLYFYHTISIDITSREAVETPWFVYSFYNKGGFSCSYVREEFYKEHSQIQSMHQKNRDFSVNFQEQDSPKKTITLRTLESLEEGHHSLLARVGKASTRIMMAGIGYKPLFSSGIYDIFDGGQSGFFITLSRLSSRPVSAKALVLDYLNWERIEKWIEDWGHLSRLATPMQTLKGIHDIQPEKIPLMGHRMTIVGESQIYIEPLEISMLPKKREKIAALRDPIPEGEVISERDSRLRDPRMIAKLERVADDKERLRSSWIQDPIDPEALEEGGESSQSAVNDHEQEVVGGSSDEEEASGSDGLK